MITYPLGASTLSEKQLGKLHLVVEQAYLPKGGLNRKFPKGVLGGPTLYGGQGDPGVYTRKGYNQIQLLSGRIQHTDEQREMLRSVTTFSERKVRKIQQAADIAYRPKFGLNRNFPNTVVHSPPIYYDLSHPAFYT